MNTYEEIQNLLSQLGFTPDECRTDLRLRDELGIDSTELVEIVVALEQRFAFRVDPGAEAHIATFGDLAELVERRHQQIIPTGSGA